VANDSGVQPGWYADPLGRFELRYYNGTAWTADVSNGGDRFVDPMGLDVGISGAQATFAQVPRVGAETDTNSAATAAMVLGIVAVSIAWLPFIVVFGALAAVLAIVFGVIGVRRSASSGAGRSRSIVGLVTGTSGLVVAALGVALTVVVVDVYDAYLDPAPNETEITSCDLAGSRATAIGAITNLGDSSADFSVLVGFVRPGTDNADRTARVELDDVGAGQTAVFEVESQVGLEDIECTVVDVNGPLPFGLALD
jgi:hypothetical protein